MKNTKLLAFIAAAVMLIFSLAACTTAPQPAATPTANAATQAPEPTQTPAVQPTQQPEEEGRTVTLDAPAEKVVAITAGDVEIIYALGAGDVLIGRGEYCDYPEEALAVAAVQSGAQTNIEQIISLAPELVIMNVMDQTQEQVDALENAGIPVVMTDANTIAETYDAITLIGQVLGHQSEAESVVSSMKDAFAQIGQNKSAEEKTVYFEVSPLQYGLWTAGSGTFMDEIAAMLGLKNAFADVEGWAEISEEQVIQRDPDYIVTITMYFGEGPTPVEEILSRDGWQQMKAVTGNKIFNADSNAISRPGPRLVDAAKSLYAFVTEE